MRLLVLSWQRLSGSRIRTFGPRAWAPPRLRIVDPQKYFPISHNVYVVGPDVQRNPALTATESGSWMRRSFFLYHTYTTSTSCSRSAEGCYWSFVSYQH